MHCFLHTALDSLPAFEFDGIPYTIFKEGIEEKSICERLSIKLRPSLLSGSGKLPIFETVELLGNVLKAALQEIDVCDYLNKVVSFKCCLV